MGTVPNEPGYVVPPLLPLDDALPDPEPLEDPLPLLDDDPLLPEEPLLPPELPPLPFPEEPPLLPEEPPLPPDEPPLPLATPPDEPPLEEPPSSEPVCSGCEVPQPNGNPNEKTAMSSTECTRMERRTIMLSSLRSNRNPERGRLCSARFRLNQESLSPNQP
jgi:hypothetical protein